MKPAQVKLVQAQADARAARSRLTETLSELQERASPATLLVDARGELDALRKTVRTVVDDRPQRATVGGIMATLVVLAWPLSRWRRRRKAAARAARIRGD